MDDGVIVLRARAGVIDEVNSSPVMYSPCIPRDPKQQLSVQEEFRRAIRIPEIRMVGRDEKYCINCGEVRLMGDFDNTPETRDGKHSWCKPCRRAYQAKWKYEAREMERMQLRAEGRYRGRGRPRAA